MLTEVSAYEIVVPVDEEFVSSFCCSLCNVKTVSCENHFVALYHSYCRTVIVELAG